MTLADRKRAEELAQIILDSQEGERMRPVLAAAIELANYVRPNAHKHITEVNLIAAVDAATER